MLSWNPIAPSKNPSWQVPASKRGQVAAERIPMITPRLANAPESPIVKIVYTLSETGRKLSLLTGGNGRRFQFVRLPVTKELLDLATVTETGKAFIFLTPHIPKDVGILGDQQSCDLAGLANANFQFTCPRRKAIVEGYNFQFEARLVTLDHEWPTDILAPRFDYDKPFTPDEISAYILSIPQGNAEALQAAEALAAEKNKENTEFRRQQQRFGGAKLSEWLASPYLSGRVISEHPDGSGEVELERFGNSTSLKVSLDATDLKVFVAKRDDRRQAAKDEQDARDRQKIKDMEARVSPAIKERDDWINKHGSRRLRLALTHGLINTLKNVLEEERIAHDIGPTWISLRKLTPGIKQNEILNPQENHLAELDETLAEWPKCNVRLRSVQQLSQGAIIIRSTNPWRIALMMDAPWDEEVTLVRFLTDNGDSQ